MNNSSQSKQYRKAGIQLNAEILKTVDKTDLLSAAKLLGMLE
ncbi:hypothetical protein ACF5W4_17065 [Bacillota bacterium Lsc_1132]